MLLQPRPLVPFSRPVFIGGSSLPVTANLAAWFDASQIAGLSDGAQISQWDDLSGNANHATRSPSDAVVYKVAVQNGLGVVRGDGTGGLTTATSVFVGTGARTVFIVCKPDAISSTNTMCNLGFNSSPVNQGGWYNVTSEVGLRVESGLRIFSTALSTSLFKLLALTNPTSPNANNAAAWINGSSLGVTSTSARAIDTAAGGSALLGGYGGGGANYFDGDVAEIIAYSAELDTTDRQTMETYLINKWGL